MKRFYYLIAACLLIGMAGCRKEGKLLSKEAYDVYAPFSKGDTLAYTDDTTTIYMVVTSLQTYEDIVSKDCKCLSESGLNLQLTEVESLSDRWLKLSVEIGSNTDGHVWHIIRSELYDADGKQLYSFDGLAKNDNYTLLDEVILSGRRSDSNTSEESGVLRKGYGLVRFTDPDGRTWRLVGYEEGGL